MWTTLKLLSILAGHRPDLLANNKDDVGKWIGRIVKRDEHDEDGNGLLPHVATRHYPTSASMATSIARLLLDLGASSDPVNFRGSSPLHFCADGDGAGQKALAQLLID